MSRNHKYGGFYINILLKLFQPQKKQGLLLAFYSKNRAKLLWF